MRFASRALFIAVLLLTACKDKLTRALNKMGEEHPSGVLADLGMRSDVIVEGQILRVYWKVTDEVGVIECTYQLVVNSILKGSIDSYIQGNFDCHGFENVKDSVILFRQTHYEYAVSRFIKTSDFFKEAEHQKCDRVLLFLRTPDGYPKSGNQTYSLTDRWVGALTSTYYLTECVKRIVKKGSLE